MALQLFTVKVLHQVIEAYLAPFLEQYKGSRAVAAGWTRAPTFQDMSKDLRKLPLQLVRLLRALVSRKQLEALLIEFTGHHLVTGQPAATRPVAVAVEPC